MTKLLTSYEREKRGKFKKLFHSVGVDTIEIDTAGSLVEPIIRYFKIREKRH
jgi:hypothetical protein